MRRSFGGGAQSGAALKRVNTVYMFDVTVLGLRRLYYIVNCYEINYSSKEEFDSVSTFIDKSSFLELS